MLTGRKTIYFPTVQEYLDFKHYICDYIGQKTIEQYVTLKIL